MNACCPDAPPVAIPASLEERDALLAHYARALSHPARLAILRILLRRNACVCGEIVDELPLAQSTVSQHLKILKEAGLIRGAIDPPRTCYCIEPSAFAALEHLLTALRAVAPTDQPAGTLDPASTPPTTSASEALQP